MTASLIACIIKTSSGEIGPTKFSNRCATTLNLEICMTNFVSRAGQKLAHALEMFSLDVASCKCADLGCSTGGFTDCLLQAGAEKVYSVDTGYGVLDWKLRNDPRVVVLERTNAMHVQLPEMVAVVTIDVAWTRQRNILPAAKRLIATTGKIISLIKPHYEAPAELLRKGILAGDDIPAVLKSVEVDIQQAGFQIIKTVESPVKGSKGNTEYLFWLQNHQ